MLTNNVPNIIPINTVMNTTINSLAMQLENMVTYAIQIVFTGTPTGSFKLQASNDPVANPALTPAGNGAIIFNPAHWSDVKNSTFAVAAAGDVMWNYQAIPGFTYVRVVYSDSSSGVSTAIITSATFNAKGQ